jgi:competence protein ComER
MKYTIGIIGCGTMGCAIVDQLLKSGYESHHIAISTRRPQQLLQRYPGINVCFDNKWVAQQADILFLCVLPSQLHSVSSEIRSKVRGLLVSIIIGYSREKLSTLLNCSCCLTIMVWF